MRAGERMGLVLSLHWMSKSRNKPEANLSKGKFQDDTDEIEMGLVLPLSGCRSTDWLSDASGSLHLVERRADGVEHENACF